MRNYESYNDVRLLNERLDGGRKIVMLEVGCATGDFYRYLRIKYPGVSYYGLDISRPAIQRAQDKFRNGRFFLIEPGVKLESAVERIGLSRRPAIVYAKDVVHHQTKPLEFVSELIEAASEAVILRCRTRDVGKTEQDPEQSCQYHYGGWMPYFVTNIGDLIEHIRSETSQAEIVLYRNHVVLGGQHNRYLPKDCYLTETGTAETAVGVFMKSDRPNTVTIEDRLDQNPKYTFAYRLRQYLGRALRILR